MNPDDLVLPRVLRLTPYALLLTFFFSCSHIVILHDPLSPEEHNDLGVAYEQKGELDAAIREYQAALKKRRDFPTARVNLGNAYLGKKEYAKAEQQYAGVLKADSANIDAGNNLAMLYLEIGKHPDEALRLARNCVRLAPKEPRCHDTLGLLLLRSGDRSTAREEFQRALELLPEEESGLRREIKTHLRQIP